MEAGQPLIEAFPEIRAYSFAYLDLIGQGQWQTTWTPVRTGWTDVGTPTVTARFRVVGGKCEFQVKVVPSTSIATVAGTSYTDLPIMAAGLSGAVVMTNATANTAVGTGHIDVANSRCYLPAQVASGNTFNIAGWFEI